MQTLSPRELAESTKKYISNFLRNFDSNLIEEGPHELFNEFLGSFGNSSSDFIMDIIIPTNVFKEEELKILYKIEECFVRFLKKDSKNWYFLKKEEYLEIKSLSFDYLYLIYGMDNG